MFKSFVQSFAQICNAIMSDLDKCSMITSLVPIIKDLQAKVLDLENVVKTKEQRYLNLEEEVRELQRKMVTPAVQPIK